MHNQTTTTTTIQIDCSTKNVQSTIWSSHLILENPDINQLSSFCWKINNSLLCDNNNRAGRCIQATRNIAVNELIFREKPLLLGPLISKNSTSTLIPLCVSCYRKVNNDDVCINKCGLPICPSDGHSDDKNNINNKNCIDLHKNECALLLSWKPKQSFIETTSTTSIISFETLKILTAIRALLLSKSQIELLNSLQANRQLEKEQFIDEYLNRIFDQPPNLEIIEIIKRTTAVLSTNAFQSVINSEADKTTSLKGLFALTSLMNNDCIPNTRHSLVQLNDNSYALEIYATVPIEKDSEITTTYTQLLWNTQSRRVHLQLTKQFLCSCLRCKNPDEFNTYLSAIKCFNQSCSKIGGRLLSQNPINISSEWKCNLCANTFPYSKIYNFLHVISSIVKQSTTTSINSGDNNTETTTNCTNNNNNNNKNCRRLIEFLCNGVLTRMLCNTNQFIVELKLKIIWNINEIGVNEITLDDFYLKEQYCLDILEILKNLQTGECTLKGLICYELFKCREQLKKANHHDCGDTTIVDTNDIVGNKFINIDEKEQINLIKISWSILKGNLAAPDDLKIFYNLISCK